MTTYALLFFFIGSALLITKKHTILVITSIITTIFTIINGFGYYYIQKTYNVVDNISKEEITYTTNVSCIKHPNSSYHLSMVLNGGYCKDFICENTKIKNKE